MIYYYAYRHIKNYERGFYDLKRLVLICVCIIILLGLSINVMAESTNHNFSAKINKNAVAMGETIKLTISYSGIGNIGAFLVSVNYENDLLTFVKGEKESAAINNYLEYNDTGGDTLAVFTSQKKEKLSGDIVTFYYKVNDKINVEFIDFNIIISDVVDTNAVEISGETEIITDVVVSQEPSDSSELLELIPSYGKLDKAFSPAVTEYSMSVPYSVKQISFETRGAEGAVISVNRKNLGSGGSTSKFIITVTAADKVTKTAYTVMVTRGKYEPEHPPDVEPGEKPGLLSIRPSEGKLNEEFNPNIYTYTMNVPYGVSTLDFITTVSEGASAKINKKRLGSGGSVTDFLITVTAPDYEEKVVYTISVTRGEYEPHPPTDTEPGERPALLSMVPSEGELNEEFNWDKYEYTMSVPYEVSSLEFVTEVTKGASAKVNKKRLGSGGSVTEFLITVTAPDYEEKVVYSISVTRGEYVRNTLGTISGGTSSKAKGESNQLNNGEVGHGLEESLDDTSNYVLDKYTQTAPLIVNQNSFSAFALGAVIAIVSISVGVIMLLIIVRGINKKNKHDSKGE